MERCDAARSRERCDCHVGCLAETGNLNFDNHFCCKFTRDPWAEIEEEEAKELNELIHTQLYDAKGG